jgi:hypothetical protein
MAARVFLAALIAFGSLPLAACEGSASLAAGPGRTPSPRTEQTTPAVTRTPSGIFLSTSVPALDAEATATAEPDPTALIVQGRVFDAASGQRLSHATLDWQFAALDWQQHNGQLQVPADGLYRLQLPARDDDEVIIIARAPGYLPSMARLMGRQLNPYGSRLNFGLVAAAGPAPTVPGALGTIQVHGTVYNLARGLKDPIANARVIIVNRSMVRPEMQLEATTSVTGTFVIPVRLHVTDQLDVTITASGYQTATLARNAQDLAKKPLLSIGLKPAPKP